MQGPNIICSFTLAHKLIGEYAISLQAYHLELYPYSISSDINIVKPLSQNHIRALLLDLDFR